ncbi:replicative DNA helicase [Methylobacterium sp. J-090]|uniref:replicative DNA helicase n=1 Tax=Methylobacterium sp. J-090 TaxID=2836666 RepID=UPI001FBB4C0E|nr:DnaB-like helicase C-terminal domain-containing protein [Methylobacterium sp. J-090]MCJ2080156.1 AAA family ATPase [Methylobacterium sp. J-090]
MDHPNQPASRENVVHLNRLNPQGGASQHPAPTPGAQAAIDVEQALLGAILQNPEALDRARSHVQPEDFLEDVHRHVFRVMCERRDAGQTIDLGLMKAVLGKADLGGLTIGGYLARLMREATTVVGAPGYARSIAEAAQTRRVLEISLGGVERGSVDYIASPSSYAAEMIEALDAVASAGLVETARRSTLGHSAARAMDKVERLRRGENERGTLYGIPSLDRATLGMRAPQFIVLAGRPGMGKTATALHIGLSAARRSGAVGFFSLEMDDVELAERVLSAMAYDSRQSVQISYRAIAQARDLSDDDLRRLYEARYEAAKVPIWIEQQPSLTLSQIAARARQMKAKAERQGISLAAIIVDHIGLVKPSTRYSGNRVQEMTEISAGLKGLAKELGVPVVGLCQLNRSVEHREEKRPLLSDLRDSGSIEQDADVVLGLYREAYYLENKPDRSDEEEDRLARQLDVLEIGILKQRSGPTIRIECFCDIACNILAEMAS